jgi:photosystem II stability/assembly factor-like uncharacterized protein
MAARARIFAVTGDEVVRFVGLRGGTLLLTDDAGESWSRLAAQLPDLIDLAAAPD